MVTDYSFVLAAGTFADTRIEEERFADRPVTVRMASLATPDAIARETAMADGVIVTTNPLPSAAIAALGPRIRIIGRAGIGLDAIDLEAAERRGIAVFHTPDYATEEVATHAVALILALNRRLMEGNAIARGRWTAWRDLAPIEPLHEQTVGVVGCGRIGRAVIARLAPLVRDVIAFDPYAPEAPPGARLAASLDELLHQSAVVTLHSPLTPDTRHMIGARELAALPRGAHLVNVSRGPLIDEPALIEALAGGQIGAAALDVLEAEPLPPDAPILAAPNVLLSPHVAWYSVASERRTRVMTVDGMLTYLEGRPVRDGRLAVDPRAGGRHGREDGR